MKECIINETLLQKNIDLLKLYSSEENKKLKQIFSLFDKTLNYYETSNTSLFRKKYASLTSNIPTLYENRDEYCDVLKKAIFIYNKTSNEFIDSSKKIGEINNV